MKKYIGILIVTLGALTSWSYITSRSDHKERTTAPGQKPIVVLVPSYNNEQWLDKNLDSIFSQKYDNYNVIYIDDASTDSTALKVRDYIARNSVQDSLQIIVNEKNRGAMANIYNAIHTSVADNAIVLTLDGDDWLAHDRVFETINNVYADPDVWMSYGTYTHYPAQQFGSNCEEIPQAVIDQNAYRRYKWCTSHLRTLHAWLFKKIKKEDLLDGDEFYRVTWDQAFMFPLLEMAAGRWKFIPDILYVYNVQNPLNDFKMHLRKQLLAEREIRAKQPYQRLPHAQGNV